MKNTVNPNWSFYSDLLPKIVSWSCDYDQIPLLPLLEAGNSGIIALKQSQIRSILANAFFLNTTDLAFVFGSQGRWIGTLDFSVIYSDVPSVCIQRILCQLNYFVCISELPENRTVTFERYLMETTPNWEKEELLIEKDTVRVHTNSMEASKARGFVDFANADLHIGGIIPSMTQEEVLFSACPECFVGLLFTERYLDNEVMIIKKVQRFSTYTGYGASFQWTGAETIIRLHDIVVIDATMEDQFTRKMILRDLNKAWKGFSACGGTISTGHWGCGAFGGNKTLKFLQQLCAATCAHVTLDYSTYNDITCAENFKEILQLTSAKMKVKDIFEMMETFKQDRTALFSVFDDYVMLKLRGN